MFLQPRDACSSHMTLAHLRDVFHFLEGDLRNVDTCVDATEKDASLDLRERHASGSFWIISSSPPASAGGKGRVLRENVDVTCSRLFLEFVTSLIHRRSNRKWEALSRDTQLFFFRRLKMDTLFCLYFIRYHEDAPKGAARAFSANTTTTTSSWCKEYKKNKIGNDVMKTAPRVRQMVDGYPYTILNTTISSGRRRHFIMLLLVMFSTRVVAVLLVLED